MSEPLTPPTPPALADEQAKRSSLCSDWVGSGAGQTLARPTAAGWWWWRKKGAWLMVEVHACRSGLYCPFLDMADAKANGHLGYKEWLGEWAGPLMPPPLPSDQAHAPATQKL